MALLNDISNVSAAHLLELSDGRILLIYGNRYPDNLGIDLRISEDEGNSWSAPRRVVDLTEGDNGYPSAMEFPDGRVMIVYYTSGIPSHGRYHMGVANILLNEL